ncbi:hypothetical protein [Microbacterium sp. cf332]|uniref:hypothetical protein n=1 Tax=Microbacterium sp. cf332 TaxID=1761804 RepID=UPI000890D297|nr:hypothetical protein [Microbacterium sp. cf332]SDQ19582.1 hypothetical protein SAMN04487847_0833 [Microbacterium sp. cf332]
METVYPLLGVVAVVIMALIAVASAVLARSSDVAAAWRTERPTILLTVSVQRWRRVMVRACGVLMAGVGIITLTAPLARPEDSPAMRYVGLGALLIGAALIWLAHGMTRMRLEVAAHEIYVSRGFLPPMRVATSEITRLLPNVAGRYGGIVGKRERRTLFSTTTAMTGHSELMIYLQSERPDLFVAGALR